MQEFNGHNSGRTFVRSERRLIAVADRIKDWAGKAFQEIHPKNPLNKLNDSDRKILWAMLMVYAHASGPKHGERANAFFKELDSMSKTVADAAKLGTRLKSQVFKGTSSEALRPFTAGFDDLPARLIEFSKTLGEALNSFGKQGHKAKILTNQSLVQASEFVLVKTGQHYDEHLAELFQAIGNRPEELELSGDAIRKKREHLKESYPVVYANALKRAKSEYES
jgi:hypothetical protein